MVISSHMQAESVTVLGESTAEVFSHSLENRVGNIERTLCNLEVIRISLINIILFLCCRRVLGAGQSRIGKYSLCMVLEAAENAKVPVSSEDHFTVLTLGRKAEKES